ncbi:MAG: hypothetical protein U9O53_04045 [archaeon]|nr:hypothetical protein [archaeon]
MSAPIAASAGLFDQQCPESSLSEMVIGGERVDDPLSCMTTKEMQSVILHSLSMREE